MANEISQWEKEFKEIQEVIESFTPIWQDTDDIGFVNMWLSRINQIPRGEEDKRRMLQLAKLLALQMQRGTLETPFTGHLPSLRDPLPDVTEALETAMQREDQAIRETAQKWREKAAAQKRPTTRAATEALQDRYGEVRAGHAATRDLIEEDTTEDTVNPKSSSPQHRTTFKLQLDSPTSPKPEIPLPHLVETGFGDVSPSVARPAIPDPRKVLARKPPPPLRPGTGVTTRKSPQATRARTQPRNAVRSSKGKPSFSERRPARRKTPRTAANIGEELERIRKFKEKVLNDFEKKLHMEKEKEKQLNEERIAREEESLKRLVEKSNRAVDRVLRRAEGKIQGGERGELDVTITPGSEVEEFTRFPDDGALLHEVMVEELSALKETLDNIFHVKRVSLFNFLRENVATEMSRYLNWLTVFGNRTKALRDVMQGQEPGYNPDDYFVNPKSLDEHFEKKKLEALKVYNLEGIEAEMVRQHEQLLYEKDLTEELEERLEELEEEYLADREALQKKEREWAKEQADLRKQVKETNKKVARVRKISSAIYGQAQKGYQEAKKSEQQFYREYVHSFHAE